MSPSDATPGTAPETPDAAPAAPAERRPAPRLVFKDPFEQQTSDDTDRGWGESTGERGLDWYRSQRPPHHGEK
ncbi:MULTISPECIES: hypothetical protein [Kitasatospora]|uniref:Uncharacterized protein n=1 Tax=Kitasatospora setae (strain ATCC 33774 / DSM 43861 / JCM 3304 / KCC A-0304 / NBRC 14216 / KM-6054) TaxID=452652 RepID=E4NFS8_KITSK|nr:MULTISPECIES: hypothetical protein [Kitasatospora]BAJ30358.1 hypothetical protein KSE_45770 [Kitasatospora setae KM-6054]